MPSIVLVHGAGMDHTVWRFQSDWLAHQGCQVRSLDLPAHGQAAGEPFASVEEGAEWLGALLGAEGPVDSVVGHSFGALIALEASVRFPGRIGCLVLVGAGARMPVHPKLLGAAGNDLPGAARLIADWSLPRGEAGSEEWEDIVGLVESSRPGVLAADLQASNDYDATPVLGSVEVPVLIVAGEDDRMVMTEAATALATGIPDARTVVISGSGHQPMISAPEEFNRQLGAFVGL